MSSMPEKSRKAKGQQEHQPAYTTRDQINDKGRLDERKRKSNCGNIGLTPWSSSTICAYSWRLGTTLVYSIAILEDTPANLDLY